MHAGLPCHSRRPLLHEPRTPGQKPNLSRSDGAAWVLQIYPDFDFSVPGTVPVPEGKLTYDIITKEPYEVGGRVGGVGVAGHWSWCMHASPL